MGDGANLLDCAVGEPHRLAQQGGHVDSYSGLELIEIDLQPRKILAYTVMQLAGNAPAF